jgi:hypothetical protein
MESTEIKEIALANSLSKQITKEVNSKSTPLSNNPFFPENYGESFEMDMILRRFNETKDDLYKIGDIEGEDIQNLLPSLIEKCKRIEEPIRRNLEKIAYNFIIDTFNVPEGVLNLTVELTDDIANTTLNVRVQAENDMFEYEDVEHKRSLMMEIHKRKLLNALMSGGALRYASNIKKYVADVYELNPKLPELYRIIIALNEYMLFASDKIEINDKNKNQLGLSNIVIGNDQVKTEVRVEATIFPILIYEEIKAFLELSAAHGLPTSKEEAHYVMGKCDYIQAEPWYMRVGPALWDIFSGMLGEVEDSLIPYIFMEISKLPINLFEIAMQEIFSKTKKGKRILERIKEKHLNQNEYNDFSNRMELANSTTSIINDETIKENTSKTSLLTEISCKDAYQRFYSDIPEGDYKKIIAAVQDDFNVLSADAKWVLRLYKKKSPRLMEDLYKLRNEYREGYLQIFNRLKDTHRINGAEADLNRYNSISELGAFTSKWDIQDVWASAEELKKTQMRDEFIQAKDDINKLYEDDMWLVVSPNSYEASCYWGDNTEWCTAYKDDEDYYNSYASDGPLYININKQTGEKYQFHFQSESFMDQWDCEIDAPILKRMNANEGLILFYEKLAVKCDNPEIYFRLTFEKNEFGMSHDIMQFGNKWYYYSINGPECKHLDFADWVGEWDFIDGFYANDPNDQLCYVKGLDGKFNFINGYGDLITRSWFDDYGSWDITYGVLPIKRKGKWTLIDNYGKDLCSVDFDNIREVEDDYYEIDHYIGIYNGKEYKIGRDGSIIKNDDDYNDEY